MQARICVGLNAAAPNSVGKLTVAVLFSANVGNTVILPLGYFDACN